MLWLFTFGLNGQAFREWPSHEGKEKVKAIEKKKKKKSYNTEEGHLDSEEASFKVYSPKVEMHNISGLINI